MAKQILKGVIMSKQKKVAKQTEGSTANAVPEPPPKPNLEVVKEDPLAAVVHDAVAVVVQAVAKEPKLNVELDEEVFDEVFQMPLTNKEVMKKGEELAQCHCELDAIADELKEAKDDAKAKASPVEARIKELVQQIQTKKEKREVECQCRWKWTEGIVETILADNHKKVLASRKISEHERQMKFPEANEGQPEEGSEQDNGSEE